jgi:hypothetical protein
MDSHRRKDSAPASRSSAGQGLFEDVTLSLDHQRDLFSEQSVLLGKCECGGEVYEYNLSARCNTCGEHHVRCGACGWLSSIEDWDCLGACSSDLVFCVNCGAQVDSISGAVHLKCEKCEGTSP